MRVFAAGFAVVLGLVLGCGGTNQAALNAGPAEDVPSSQSKAPIACSKGMTPVSEETAPRRQRTQKEREASLLGTSSGVPYENCGYGQALDHMKSMKCADGAPFGGHMGKVARALTLVQTFASGGRCGNEIEHYKLRCRDSSFDFFLDRRICLPGESWQA